MSPSIQSSPYATKYIDILVHTDYWAKIYISSSYAVVASSVLPKLSNSYFDLNC